MKRHHGVHPVETLWHLIEHKLLHEIKATVTQQDFPWGEIHDNHHNQGLLYVLFPVEPTGTYDKEFSQGCFRMLMEHGYQPHLDDDVYHDFLTESHKECFRDFARVLREYPSLLCETFEGLITSSIPYYQDRLEHLIGPELVSQHLDVDGEKVSNLEFVWRKMQILDEMPHWGYDLHDHEVVEEVSKVTHAFLELMPFDPSFGRLRQLMQLVIDQHPDISQESQQLLHHCLQRVDALIQHHVLSQEVNQGIGPKSKKM